MGILTQSQIFFLEKSKSLAISRIGGDLNYKFSLVYYRDFVKLQDPRQNFLN